jgi:tetratricopeptide (TPR) repeat protein
MTGTSYIFNWCFSRQIIFHFSVCFRILSFDILVYIYGNVLKGLIAVHQDDPRLFAMYGDLLYKQGDAKEALVQYLKSLQLSEQIYVVWEQVLNIYLSQKDFKKAIETGSAAVSVYPNQAVLYYYLAFAQHREDQYAAALENIATAEELAAGEQELLASVEDVYALVLMNLAKFDLAEVKIQKALQLNPVKKMLYLEHYGDILALKGNKEKALDLWKQARDLGSKTEDQ